MWFSHKRLLVSAALCALAFSTACDRPGQTRKIPVAAAPALPAPPPPGSPVDLAQPAPLAKDIAALPRIRQPRSSAELAINADLEAIDQYYLETVRECLKAQSSDAWRSTESVMQGPEFLVVMSRDDTYCGGNHPNQETMVYTYDLRTGNRLSGTDILPGFVKAAYPGFSDLVTSARLQSFYVTAMSPGDEGPDEDCRDALGQPNISFRIWPTAGGIVINPDLAHVVQACGGGVTVPRAKLREWGAPERLLRETENAKPAASPKTP